MYKDYYYIAKILEAKKEAEENHAVLEGAALSSSAFSELTKELNKLASEGAVELSADCPEDAASVELLGIRVVRVPDYMSFILEGYSYMFYAETGTLN